MNAMKAITKTVPVLVVLLLSSPTWAPKLFAQQQQTLNLSPENLDTYYSTISQAEYKGRQGLHLKNMDGDKSDHAVAFFKDVIIEDGIIEVDIASEVFAGIAFRGLDGDHYDKVYFRPFNSGTEKHQNTVQYASPGTEGASWHALREGYPGQYEAGADIPVLEWFRARLVVKGDSVSVFVNGAVEPVLVVDQLLSGSEQGRIGIWGWDVYFSNFTYTPLD